MKLSKSDYVLGLRCPNALRFKKFHPEIEQEKNEAILEQGTKVGELACDKFPGGVRINAKPWEDAAVDETIDAINKNAPYIYEATLKTPTDEYCAVDILKNNNDGTWDIIEVKSVTEVHKYHFFDVSFQRYVFDKCGIKIRDCYILTLDNTYVRHGALDVQQLFKLNYANDDMQSLETVENEIKRIRAFLNGPELGIAISKAKCGNCAAFGFECAYKHHCWANVPEYSVFDVFRGKKADDMYDKYGADIANLPESVYCEQQHKGDIESFLSDAEITNVDGLKDFVSTLKYPLYFLDYESISPAVPLFDNSRAFQHICFQYSLHVIREKGGAIEHYEYLHDKQTDPRPELIKHLIADCGTDGSVIVYNKSFEESKNKDMMRDFPQYADALDKINARIVDLLIPFRERLIYKPCQNGSASIKKTLPAFVPSMSYENLGIHKGDEASEAFLSFVNGEQTNEETNKMMNDLREYCGQDTMAMVELLNVIYKKIDE